MSIKNILKHSPSKGWAKKSSFFDFDMYLNIVSPLCWHLVSRNTFWDMTKHLEPFNQNKNIIFYIFWCAKYSGSGWKNLDLAFWPTFVPQIYDTKIDPRYNGCITIGFVFVSAFQNICYLSQKKVSSLRNVSFSNSKENPHSKFMGFSTRINLDWNNIHMKAIKGVYNNKNSKFGVFNNWSSERYAQNSDTLFPKLCFGSPSRWLKNLEVKCWFTHPIRFSSKTPVLENSNFLRLIKRDFENLKAYP